MRRLLIALAALIGVACLGLIILTGLAFFRGAFGPFTFSPATTATMIFPTHTPWVTPTADQATKTPWVTPTPGTPPDTPNPPTAEPIQPTGDSVSYEGVSFTLDPSVASGASGQVVPENPSSADGPYWDVNPQYVKISLNGYPLTGTFWSPVIAVYPVADYRRLSPPADQMIDELEAFLAEKPEQTDQIPFLRVVNAGQVFHSNVQYLDFQNGNGVRFLTLYAQYPAPVNNHDLFYTFQGLTADGNYVISIILPANHPSLLASADELSSDEFDAIVKDYDNYRAEIAATLSAQPASSFTPDLAKLDALVTSLAIDPDSFPH
jgi:hypothetical protein